MRNIIQIVLLLIVMVYCTGCCMFFPQTWKDYNGQVKCTETGICGFGGGGNCTVYDPVLKQQVPISESTGVVNSCNTTTHTCTVYLFEHAQCYTCQSTFTDSMGNTWTTKAYNEEK